MELSRRQKRVGSLVKEALSRLLITEIQDTSSGLITITRVEMSGDLKTAHVYLSFFDRKKEQSLLSLLENKKGYLRKSIASLIKLKYNPCLIFEVDPVPDYEKQIDKLIELARKNEK